MNLGIFACALGRHKIDKQAIRQVYGTQVARCRHCSTALESRGPGHWTPLAIRDAGLR